MTEEIQKISNVKYTVTEEVINRKWTTVGSKRRQLLTLSDWTQLTDSNLSPTAKHYWKTWRQKIRNIKRSAVTNPEDALELLKTLEKQSPEMLNYDNDPEIENKTDDLTVERLNRLLDEKINAILPQLITGNDVTNILNEKVEELKKQLMSVTEKIELHHDLTIAKLQVSEKINEGYNKSFPKLYSDTELFNEAVEFKIKPEGKYPLLEVWSKIYLTSLDAMAEIVIANKKNWLRDFCASEETHLNWIMRIEGATDIGQLQQILEEFNVN